MAPLGLPLHDPLILTMQGFGQHEPLIRLDLHCVSWFLSPACLSHAGWAISLHTHLFTSPVVQGLTLKEASPTLFSHHRGAIIYPPRGSRQARLLA